MEKIAGARELLPVLSGIPGIGKSIGQLSQITNLDAILNSALTVDQISKMQGFDKIPGVANLIPQLR